MKVLRNKIDQIMYEYDIMNTMIIYDGNAPIKKESSEVSIYIV